MGAPSGNLHVETSQNVPVSYRSGNIGDRMLAWILDLLFMGAYGLVVMFLGMLTGLGEDQFWVYILMLLPVFFYSFLMELFFEGQTAGKMIMKIRVIRIDGSQPGAGSYLLRWLIGLIEKNGVFAFLTLLIMALSEKGQRLGDMAAGTTVVSTRLKVSLSDTILRRQISDYVVVYPQVSLLTDKDIRIIDSIFRTSLRTSDKATLSELKKKLEGIMGIESSQQPADFIRTVINDYNHYQFSS